MAGYLRKYVGQFRVKADYDTETMDFPRLENGNLDPSFDDYYLVCKNDIKIRHGADRIMSCYIPSLGRGNNVLRKIYGDKILSKEETLPDVDIIAKKLIEDGILIDIDILDNEVYFTFKADNLEYIGSLVGISNYGKDIQPLSTKNLPKAKYIIPDKDIKVYKGLVDKLPKVTRKFQGKEIIMVDGMILNQIIKKFDKIIQKTKGRGFDINADRKKSCLKSINYIHSLGEEIWNKFIDYLREEIKKYE